MGVDELAESVGLSNWISVKKASAILGRHKSTIAEYVMNGMLPVRRRFGVTMHHLPTILEFSAPTQGKRFEGGPALTKEDILAYREFREQMDDRSKDLIFAVVLQKNRPSAVAIEVENAACREAKKLVLSTSKEAGE